MKTKMLALTCSLIFALTMSACGESDPKQSNVNGTWTLLESGGAPKQTWKITSSCSSGPCDFKADMGAGQTNVAYTWDASSGTYTNVNSATSDCLLSSGEVGAKNSYKVTSKNVFTPTKASGDDVTAAEVKTSATVTVSAAGQKAGCKAEGQIAAVTQSATRN